MSDLVRSRTATSPNCPYQDDDCAMYACNFCAQERQRARESKEGAGMTVIARTTQRIADAISAEVGGMFVGEHHPEGTQHVARLVAKALADDHQGALGALRRYGDHDRSCRVRIGSACSCGFAAAAGLPRDGER